MKEENALDKFFNKYRLCTILGLDHNKPLVCLEKKPVVLTNNYSSGSIHRNILSHTGDNLMDNMSSNSMKSKHSINEEIKEINMTSEKIVNSNVFPNINNLEYYKYKIIYDIFKFETNSIMYYSIFEMMKEICCPFFATKANKEKFNLFLMNSLDAP